MTITDGCCECPAGTRVYRSLAGVLRCGKCFGVKAPPAGLRFGHATTCPSLWTTEPGKDCNCGYSAAPPAGLREALERIELQTRNVKGLTRPGVTRTLQLVHSEAEAALDAAPPAGLREALEEIANWNAHTELCGSPPNADTCICGWTEIEQFAREALSHHPAAPSCGHPIDAERQGDALYLAEAAHHLLDHLSAEHPEFSCEDLDNVRHFSRKIEAAAYAGKEKP